MKNTVLILSILSLAVVAPFQSAHANSISWIGGTDTSWTNGANWGGTVPTDDTTTDIAVFNGTTAYSNQPSLDAFTTQSINGLSIGGASTVAVTLGTNTGTQTTSGVTANGANTITLADATGVAVGQNVTGTRIPLGTFVTNVAGNTITLSQATSGGTISDATSLTFTSALKIGNGGITLASGTPNVTNTLIAPIVLGSNQTWDNEATSRTLAVQGAIYLDSYTLTLTGVASSTISFNGSTATQCIGGTGGIIVDTAGTVNFGPGSGGRQQNTFTGGVTLNNGQITINGGNSGGGGGAGALGPGVLTINGGKLNGAGNIAGHPMTISGQVWNTDWTYLNSKTLDMGTGAISLGTAAGTTRTLTVNTGGTYLALGGGISDGTTAKGLIKDGGGLLNLYGASDYSGATTINAGTIRISGADDRLPTGTTLTIAGGASAGGTFDLNAVNQTVAGLSGGSGTVQGLVTNSDSGTSTGTLTVTGTSTFDGVIQDGATAFVALTKSTGGTLTLTGANTYTGATTVNGGTLALGANNAFSANSAITLTGGTIDLNTFSTSAASLDFAAGSSLKFNLGTPGNSTALLALAGSLTQNGSGVFTLDFSGSGQVGTYELASFSGSTFSDQSDFTLANLGSGLTGSLSLTSNLLSITISTAAIPEPSTCALLGGAAVLLVAFGHRRKNKPGRTG